MCGIGGLVNFPTAQGRSSLRKMMDVLRHRGPDDAGHYWSPNGAVGLGHQRLSIIDLSPAGRQPMSDPCGLTLTFNGEIYNFVELRDALLKKGHVFQTRTDSEVILNAYREWGIDCVQHLDGMFAFAIYDASLDRLFLARDRAGEKPLYYWHNHRRFMFASELKALLASGLVDRHIDLAAFSSYLAYGYVERQQCILHDVNKLAPGHAMLFELDSGRVSSWAYWTLPAQAGNLDKKPEELVDELDMLLHRSVKERLVADVPVGILLSGGLDSSVVTAAAAHHSNGGVRTFTVSFPGESAFDERAHARLIANHFGTDHTELEADGSSIGLIEQLAKQCDEPIGDPSVIPTFLVAQLIRGSATVALGGDGGDELFGGYKHYSFLDYQRTIRSWLPAALRRLISESAACWLPPGAAGRNQLIGIDGDLCHAIVASNVHFDHRSRQQLLAPLGDKAAALSRDVDGRRAAWYDESISPHAERHASRLWRLYVRRYFGQS